LEYGDKFIDYIDGMYAIAFYDRRINKIKLYRDRAGIKPLYYYYSDNKFAFSSELEAIVHMCNNVKFEIDKFNRESKNTYHLNLEKSSKVAKHEPLIELVSNIVILLVIVVGGMLVMNKEMTMGTLVACVNYSYSLIWPMRLLGWLSSILAMAMASIKKMKEIFDEHVEENEKQEIKDDIENFDIRFENVGFSYNNKEILHDVSLDIKYGETVAIMGISGAGKTSLVNLLTKTYDVTSGKILIGNRDINSIELEKLRNHISLVMQDTFLLPQMTQVCTAHRMSRTTDIMLNQSKYR
jgi:ABC-type multidrug transport system fused ATPase/permease subunit